MEEDNPVEITKERLEDYKSKKAETLELRHKLEHVGDGDSLIGNDTILDYKKGIQDHNLLSVMIIKKSGI